MKRKSFLSWPEARPKGITPALTFFRHSRMPEESECGMAIAICGFRSLIAYPVNLCLPRVFGVVNPVQGLPRASRGYCFL